MLKFPFYCADFSTPFTANIPQAVPTKPVLRNKTDIYFRSFDQNNADVYLFKSLHSAEWWSQQTRGLNFRREDVINASLYNHILWQGMHDPM
jgi:hypothetical protein